MWFKRERRTRIDVLDDGMRRQFNAVEMASILFCLNLKFKEKRDLYVVKMSRDIAKKTANNITDFTSKLFDVDIHLVGSVVEGVNGPKSDIDFMCCFRNGFCCEADLFRTETAVKNVFLADCLNASPGYALLWDASAYIEGNIRSWEPLKLNKLVEENTLLFIKNTADGEVKAVARFGTMVLDNSELTEKLLESHMTRNGPAISSVTGIGEVTKFLSPLWTLDVGENIKNLYTLLDKGLGKISTDQVLAFPLHCKSILRNYINRKRRYQWPSESLLQEIEAIPTYVVPVGRKGSRFESKEWRISFTLTETHLVKSLNEVQLMLLYQLKLVVKEHLATICPDISSYVIKNLVLWMIECSPAEFFQYKNFIPLYKSSLLILSKRIWKGCMPNYMIPKRNLFEGKLSCFKRFQLDYRLSRLIKEGINIGTINEINKITSCQEINRLREQIVEESQNEIRNFTRTNELLNYIRSLEGFVSPTTLLSRLMDICNKICPKIPADIPLD